MTQTVLVPVEGSPLSREALEVAMSDYPDAQVVVCHVMDPIDAGLGLIRVMRPNFEEGAPPGTVSPEEWETWQENARETAEDIFSDARDLAEQQDRHVETVLEFGEPESIIVEYAEENDIDRIVMGSHARTGPARFLLGSVAETVARRAPVPVMIVR